MICTFITTTFLDGKRMEEREKAKFIPDEGIEKQAVNLHPEVSFQVFEGFGGAFTDSAGYVYAQMHEDRKSVV